MAATLAAYGLFWLFTRDTGERVRRRLEGASAGPGAAARPGVSDLFVRVSTAASKAMEPKNEDERSRLRRDLSRAGYHSPNAWQLMVGAKLVLLTVGVMVGYLSALMLKMDSTGVLMCVAAGGLGGYLAPVVWLTLRIRTEQKSLEHALPDALDLMVVCVESGLTLDAAMQRVSKEIVLAHPALARELAITHIESQMGVPRAEAMRKLADRTGSTALKSLTAMLIQADRFGTSIADALRVYSESLRIKRQYAAQEMAAKAAVKLTFPLVFCIFPAIMAVAGGPAVIKLIEVLPNGANP